MAVSRSPLESCLKCRFLGPNPRDGEWVVLERGSCESVFLRSMPGVSKAGGPRETLGETL